ncbi:flagellar biosynthesis protein FlgA [Rhodococcus hoagii]|nr:flagellar biosynthesis protein FlgA [Prescottella equi]
MVKATTKVQRRPLYLALGIALAALGVVGVVWLIGSIRQTESVLVIKKDVSQGHTLTANDLVTTELNADSGLEVIKSSQSSQVIGRRTTTSMSAGSLLTKGALTDAVIPDKGQSVVGLVLTAAKMPSMPLTPGDLVRIIDTPRQQDDPPAQPPYATAATVISVSPSPDGAQILDVVVSSTDAPALAARSATGRVSVVLDSRAR